jgi:hypothetical protein
VVERDLNPQCTRSVIDNPQFFGLFRQGVNKDVFGAFTNFAIHHIKNSKFKVQNLKLIGCSGAGFSPASPDIESRAFVLYAITLDLSSLTGKVGRSCI